MLLEICRVKSVVLHANGHLVEKEKCECDVRRDQVNEYNSLY